MVLYLLLVLIMHLILILILVLFMHMLMVLLLYLLLVLLLLLLHLRHLLPDFSFTCRWYPVPFPGPSPTRAPSSSPAPAPNPSPAPVHVVRDVSGAVLVAQVALVREHGRDRVERLEVNLLPPLQLLGRAAISHNWGPASRQAKRKKRDLLIQLCQVNFRLTVILSC